jgi:uroporphyrin-III C-methyltransferase/precorrin-2 dehydrogenase/sirohydrochlorin ferrochelatase
MFVGKRAGRPQVRQEFINAFMIRAARRGRQVVRLKGGDPFVFGRGGEEALALAAAGVRFEVVPGVSSAVAAAALANIPVTHRGIAAAFVVVSGHADEAYRPVLESLAPNRETVVVMMGLGRLDRIAELLIERGWSPATSVAIVRSASTKASSVWTGTLVDCLRGAEQCEGRPRRRLDPTRHAEAGTIVIGDVVKLRSLVASTANCVDQAAADSVDSRGLRGFARI